MSAQKNIDKICAVITAVTLILSVIFCTGLIPATAATDRVIGYENRIFDNSKVHTIDIVINDWDGFLEGCESEEYTAVNLVIDGEAVKNVGLRAKGNTSLSSVSQMGSSRYSFKIEFDQYDSSTTYHGLDKLCLNNIIQDNSYMKDYLAYTLMNNFGVDAPLCSYADVSVNGEEWGLYLAVEAVEDSFLKRNYGNQYGELYKPDSMSFGGGRGNGKGFDMGDFDFSSGDGKPDSDESGDETSETTESSESSGSKDGKGDGFPFGGMQNGQMPDMSDFDPSSMFGGQMPDMSDFDPSSFSGEKPEGMDGSFDPSSMFGGGGGFGMGSSDVKLQYSDDEFDSYSNIFNNAKTDPNYGDKKRLISSLKTLTEQSDIESVVNIEEVLRYFVVHNFLVNGDSYTGQMIHNYYLYEEDGKLSMIPWDYNLAFGTFMGGNASSSVNSPIDTPVSGGMDDRPMVSWIFSSDEYTEAYHELFSEFINSADMLSIIDSTAAMIDEYVKNDATKFCTYEEFLSGVEAIRDFCELRTESIKGQLDGTIPSTSEGQSADSSALIDTGDLNLSDMGTMNSGGGGGFGGFGGGKGGSDSSSDSESSDGNSSFDPSSFGGNGNFDPSSFGGNFGSGNMPEGFDPSSFGGNFGGGNNSSGNADASAETAAYISRTSNLSTASLSAVKLANSSQSSGNFGGNFDPNNMPEGFDPSSMGGNFGGNFDPNNMPEGFDPSSMGGNFGGNFDPNNMPEGFTPPSMGGNFGGADSDSDNQSGNSDIISESAVTVSEDSTSENESDVTSSGSEDSAPANSEGSAPANENGRGSGSDRGSRPDMGSMPSMGGSNSSSASPASLILLGVSVLVLALGLVFAFRFRRRK